MVVALSRLVSFTSLRYRCGMASDVIYIVCAGLELFFFSRSWAFLAWNRSAIILGHVSQISKSES